MPIEHWRDAKRTPEWVYAGLRVRYPAGSELTSDEYDEACQAVVNHVPGQAPPQQEIA